MSARSCVVTLPNICLPFPPLRFTLKDPMVSNIRASCSASSLTLFFSASILSSSILISLEGQNKSSLEAGKRILSIKHVANSTL
uniref:Uncharacterized protein n=1 Tax=Rhizophora mucronata TaxID=61149 RepID=A0A2P2JLI1_RHIMU